MKKAIKGLLAGLLVLGLVFGIVTAVSAAKPDGVGFDEFGYNRTARNFVGTGGSWCAAKGFEWDCSDYGDGVMVLYANDKLVMKWNEEWDRGNATVWADGPYDAWLDNEWNGMFPGGSGETWHYKIAWDAGCDENGKPSTETVKGEAYCLWGPFAMLQSHGTTGGEHVWDVLLGPAGYGAY